MLQEYAPDPRAGNCGHRADRRRGRDGLHRSPRALMQISRCGLEGAHETADWAANEGWNPGHHDPDTFYVATPKGSGRVVGRGG